MAVISNKKNSYFTGHYVANTTLTIVGNNSVSNVATSDEVVSGVSIRAVTWGANAGNWTIKRGSNTVLVLTGTGSINFKDQGGTINVDKTGTLVLELTTGPGFIMIEVNKEYSTPGSSQY